MSLKPSDIDRIIDLVTQIAEAFGKTDFLSQEEQSQLDKYIRYKKDRDHKMVMHKVSVIERASPSGAGSCGRPYYFDKEEDERCRKAINFDEKTLAALKDKLAKAKQKYIESEVKPLQKRLDRYLSPLWPEILQHSERNQLRQDIEAFLPKGFLVKHFKNTNIDISASGLTTQKEEIVDELERIKAKLKYAQAAISERTKAVQEAAKLSQTPEKPAETEKGNVNVNIFGDVQARNLQIGHDASIQEGVRTEEKKKGILKRLLKIIITCLGYLLGWLGPIKAFISKILWPK